jgi:hypothetical protein
LHRFAVFTDDEQLFTALVAIFPEESRLLAFRAVDF